MGDPAKKKKKTTEDSSGATSNDAKPGFKFNFDPSQSKFSFSNFGSQKDFTPWLKKDNTDSTFSFGGDKKMMFTFGKKDDGLRKAPNPFEKEKTTESAKKEEESVPDSVLGDENKLICHLKPMKLHVLKDSTWVER